MNKGEHVGDDLDGGWGTQRSHMDDLAAHSLERGAVDLQQCFLATDKNGDVACRRAMNAAGDRAFEHGYPAAISDGCQSKDIFRSQRAHLKPSKIALCTAHDTCEDPFRCC